MFCCKHNPAPATTEAPLPPPPLAPMKRCVLYDEIGSGARNLLGKDFPTKTSFEVALHPFDTLIEARIPQLVDLGIATKAGVTFNSDGSVTTTFSPIASWRGTKLTVDLNNAKSKRAKATLVQEGALPGLRAGADWVLHDTTRVYAQYRHEAFSVTTDVAANKRPTVAASAAAVHPRLGFGIAGAVEYRLASPAPLKSVTRDSEVTKAEGCIAYVSPKLEVSAYTTKMGQVLGCSFLHRFDAKTTIAADAQFDTTKKPMESGAGPTVEVGVQYQIDAAATVKAKVNTECVVSLSYAHKLSKYAKAVFSGSVNAANLSATGNHTFGFSLVLSD